MTTPSNDPILHTEIYKGRVITVVERPRHQNVQQVVEVR